MAEAIVTSDATSSGKIMRRTQPYVPHFFLLLCCSSPDNLLEPPSTANRQLASEDVRLTAHHLVMKRQAR